MSTQSANQIANQIVKSVSSEGGVWLFLGAADTGKTTLVSTIAAQIATTRMVAIVDADTGQSHIGPPAAVGWAIAKPNETDSANLPVKGIAFVGHISPVGHLLQMTGAIVKCVQKACSKKTTVLIDTPGFVSGSAACVFWWELQSILKPKAIVAVSRQNELDDIMRGLRNCGSTIEIVKCSDTVTQKSPEQRRAYRQERFTRYFADAKVCEISLKSAGVQNGRGLNSENARGRLVGLRDRKGDDLAMGAIVEWGDENKVIVKTPDIDPAKIGCIVVGDATIDLPIG
jgi:polynucleotide 5'-kinase involved in rRNA processing